MSAQIFPVPLPQWLEPLRDGVAAIQATDLTAFVPPEDPAPREGAVLVLFTDGPQGPGILLTERSHQMRSQPGQVSFPGGSLDPGEDAVTAALREAEEETGLDRAGVEVFAVLPRLWLPPRNFAVAPVLGYWRERSETRVVDPAEVEAIFEVSIADLLDPEQRFTVKHPLGWTGPGWAIGPQRSVTLWGFTAGVLNAIFNYVGWTQSWDESVVRGLPDFMIDWPAIARFLGVEVPADGQFDPVAAGLVTQDYIDLDRDHKPAGTP